ncbi:hypothetical protein H6F39_06625 [Anabaena sp. FACHB-1250]|uniref:hypothetical protein n=1 Tax=unclassified Anabaena TaxID=2619674 RepID=UPI001680A585|nr:MULTISPECIES: hypothetical protein [unclassified Anabaena]MBD1211666.1 hypothetical protein [Dolichospermum circinale Clear-D4]MBD2141063.1 hypothetical protein [Anabaena sp. FACHB-1250]MBD2267675.1 hypothetical protein [Anabaena sp. FACHB-1391]
MAAIKHLDIINYNTIEFPFAKIIQEIFGLPLEKLHELEEYPLFTRASDQLTVFHRKFYDAFNSSLKDMYLSFLQNVIHPYVGDDLAYQKVPTFRVGFPNNVWVGEYHRDSWYGHPHEELNFLVPFTDMYGSKSLYIESESSKGDFQPQDIKYGQILHFDHTGCTHGNEINKEGTTHVSFDFRVIPYRHYNDDVSAKSINTGMEFKIGGYFDLMQF